MSHPEIIISIISYFSGAHLAFDRGLVVSFFFPSQMGMSYPYIVVHNGDCRLKR